MNERDFDAFRNGASGRKATALMRSRNLNLRQLFEAVHAQVMQALQYMSDDEKCTTEDLCGSEMWENLSAGSDKPIGPRRVAGMCLVFMVDEKLVPLFHHYSNTGPGKNHYCKHPSVRPVGVQAARVKRVHVFPSTVIGDVNASN